MILNRGIAALFCTTIIAGCGGGDGDGGGDVNPAPPKSPVISNTTDVIGFGFTSSDSTYLSEEMAVAYYNCEDFFNIKVAGENTDGDDEYVAIGSFDEVNSTYCTISSAHVMNQHLVLSGSFGFFNGTGYDSCSIGVLPMGVAQAEMSCLTWSGDGVHWVSSVDSSGDKLAIRRSNGDTISALYWDSVSETLSADVYSDAASYNSDAPLILMGDDDHRDEPSFFIRHYSGEGQVKHVGVEPLGNQEWLNVDVSGYSTSDGNEWLPVGNGLIHVSGKYINNPPYDDTTMMYPYLNFGQVANVNGVVLFDEGYIDLDFAPTGSSMTKPYQTSVNELGQAVTVLVARDESKRAKVIKITELGVANFDAVEVGGIDAISSNDIKFSNTSKGNNKVFFPIYVTDNLEGLGYYDLLSGERGDDLIFNDVAHELFSGKRVESYGQHASGLVFELSDDADGEYTVYLNQNAVDLSRGFTDIMPESEAEDLEVVIPAR